MRTYYGYSGSCIRGGDDQLVIDPDLHFHGGGGNRFCILDFGLLIDGSIECGQDILGVIGVSTGQ